MNKNKTVVECKGEPCPLRRKPDSHWHMPVGERPENKLAITEEALGIAAVILSANCFDGLTGDEDAYELMYEAEVLAANQQPQLA